jgi:hypothetical protein
LFYSTVGIVQAPLREPEKLSLGLYLDFNHGIAEGQDLDSLLRLVRYYPARSFAFRTLKRFGSESDTDTRLWERGENLWSVLRILHDRQQGVIWIDILIPLSSSSTISRPIGFLR